MNFNSLKNLFTDYCSKHKYDQNKNQTRIIEILEKFILEKKNFFDLLFNKEKKLGFYLYGSVGVGKTMILNFFFNNLDTPKLRLHFNEFMLNFHNFRHNYKNEDNSIEKFVYELKKKYDIIYLDEFQVTNIVDAMILGKLFSEIFKKDIKVLFTSNTNINDLYKDGLQRDQFKPFISIIKKFSIEKELIINNDYRKSLNINNQRFFYPISKKNNFTINQLFREITKNKKHQKKILIIKGREFEIKNYFEKVARFTFDELCGVSLGSEDYIAIANECNYLIIENIPDFSDNNMDKQNRFITLIDILYEKKVLLTISAEISLDNFNSSTKLKKPFLRTISRIYQLTSYRPF